MAQVKMLNSRGKKKEFSFLEMVPLEFPGIYDLLERFSQCTAHPWHRPSWFTCTLEGTSLYISSLHHGLTFHLVLISLVGGIMKVESLARVLLAWVSGVSLFQLSGLLPAAWWLWTIFSSGKLANVHAILWMRTAFSLMRSDSLPWALCSCPSYPLEFSLYLLVTLLVY